MSDAHFVERTFESGDDTVTARFFQPILAPGGEYRCRWSIAWPGRVQNHFARGIDGVQSLMLAMKSVHAEFLASDLYRSGKLTYLKQYDLDLPPDWGAGQLYLPPEHDGG